MCKVIYCEYGQTEIVTTQAKAVGVAYEFVLQELYNRPKLASCSRP